jgi:hypothetical protein
MQSAPRGGAPLLPQRGAPSVPVARERSWVRTVYLYLLSLVGVLFLTFGGVRLLDMALKAFVFTQADEQERVMMRQPPLPYALERVERLGDDPSLSAADREAVRQWLADYRQWQARSGRVDPVVARRQATASSSLAMILIGLPLYLYHWGVIRRESRREPPPS